MSERNQATHGLTRRAVVSSGLAAAAAAPFAGAAAAASRAVPETWDEEVDVVVIGTGFAGLAAAHEAAKAGASVALLEKMRVPGGNSIISGGVIAAPGSPMQSERGIEDSAEALYDDMLAAGLDLNHRALARLVAEQALETVMWSIEELGAEYDGLSHLGGHAVPRSYALAAGSGAGLVVPQLARLEEMGIEPRTRTLLKRLVRDGDGRVKGVAVHEGFSHPDLDSGTPRTIRAARAVVLATGGFGGDPAFRAMQDPRLGGELDTTNHPGATSEALREALDIGCVLIQPSWIQLGPWTSPDERGFGMAPTFVQGATASYGLWVATETGERFVNELADRKTRADAIIRTGNRAIAFVDAAGWRKGMGGHAGERRKRMKESGVLMEYDSLDAMAAAHDIPAERLKETVERFNAAVAAGEDEAWGRYLPQDIAPIGEPPFYAVRLAPKIHHTMGGVAIDTEAHALDVSTGEPIPGLFAAGEVTGGVHGASRLGSCAYADCLIFGRIAGRNAAAMEPWS